MEAGETMVTAELVSSVSADTDTSAGETVIIDVDEVEAIVSIGGGSEVHVVLARLSTATSRCSYSKHINA